MLVEDAHIYEKSSLPKTVGRGLRYVLVTPEATYGGAP